MPLVQLAEAPTSERTTVEDKAITPIDIMWMRVSHVHWRSAGLKPGESKQTEASRLNLVAYVYAPRESHASKKTGASGAADRSPRIVRFPEPQRCGAHVVRLNGDLCST